MKYKVGDKVRIKSLDWYNENKDINGNVDCGFKLFTYEMSKFCGCVMTVCNRTNLGVMTMGGSASCWTDEMIEGLVEEPLYKATVDKNGNMTGEFVRLKEVKQEINLPEGYIFKDENGNVINVTKIVLEKKKKEYPKTYEECIGKLSINWDGKVEGYKHNLLATLQKLLICRDVYWKIAGEEMGLGKPWSPDYAEESYEQGSPIKYVIYYSGTHITKGRKCTPSYILSFPTEEMRDAFKENFDKDLETCKELL